MDKKLEKYYEERFSMMSTEGYKDLIEDAQTMLDSIDTVKNINSPEDLWIRKGQADILMWLINLKDESERVYKELENEESS